MTTDFSIDSLSPTLDAHVRSLRDATPDTRRAEDAQRALEDRLRRTRAPRLRRAGWIGAASAAVLAIALLVLPTLPGGGQNAFAAIQQQLRDFTTVHLTVTQQSGGMNMPTINVWAERNGRTRTDISDATSVIVDPRQHQLLTLLHGPHMAMQVTLPAGGQDAAKQADPMHWLKALAQFDGPVTELDKPRVIDGVITHGWKAQQHGMAMTVWADAQQMPRAIDVQGHGLTQHLRVRLDTAIPAGYLSTKVPDGYTAMQPDQD
ncbi:hypothetical protein [Oleiagrimonas sp. C23AA]|uniref:hypothetical protein n=1 Tax=Oleiagrimonas sp. C23AA TaxID=2719047 RepID=UPI0014240D92|nr:hypothetical protein [Oleiagrimonas sp. C23AA]NII09850.1 hypothetical protein [Oleiagrimonas sp. C23AA]